jgi:hypothetical protein
MLQILTLVTAAVQLLQQLHGASLDKVCSYEENYNYVTVAKTNIIIRHAKVGRNWLRNSRSKVEMVLSYGSQFF